MIPASYFQDKKRGSEKANKKEQKLELGKEISRKTPWKLGKVEKLFLLAPPDVHIPRRHNFLSLIQGT